MTEMQPASEAPVVVMGTPIEFGDGLKVISPNLTGTDVVPLIDGETAGILQAVNSFTIKQRIRWGEALTQGCIEQSNVYDIYDSENGNHIFVAVERSENCTRCCCAPHHSLFVEIKKTAGMQGVAGLPRDMLMGLATSMTMERVGCMTKLGLGCCICHDSCKDGFALHAGPVDEGVPVGSLGPGYEKCIGHATQPGCGGTFTPTISIMDRGAGQGEFAALAKVEGPCAFGGCSELCCDSEWKVSKMTPETFEQKIGLGDMAIITKKKPQGLAAAATEAFTDSDTYTMEFNPGANLAPQQKATMIASLLLVDYMFFEQDNGMCKCENGKVKITLCETYCCGCLCPWNITLGGEQGGGGAPPSTEMSR